MADREGMNMIAELRELDGRRQAIRGRQAIDPNHAILERIEIERKLLDAVPMLLDVLGEVRAGDAGILYWMLTGVGDEPTQDEIADLLSRYQAMAAKSEAKRK